MTTSRGSSLPVSRGEPRPPCRSRRRVNCRGCCRSCSLLRFRGSAQHLTRRLLASPWRPSSRPPLLRSPPSWSRASKPGRRSRRRSRNSASSWPPWSAALPGHAPDRCAASRWNCTRPSSPRAIAQRAKTKLRDVGATAAGVSGVMSLPRSSAVPPRLPHLLPLAGVPLFGPEKPIRGTGGQHPRY